MELQREILRKEKNAQKRNLRSGKLWTGKREMFAHSEIAAIGDKYLVICGRLWIYSKAIHTYLLLVKSWTARTKIFLCLTKVVDGKGIH